MTGNSIEVQKLFINVEDLFNREYDIVENKMRFCNRFEFELGLKNGSYSESIYDFIYNLYRHHKFISYKRYREIRDDFMKINFYNFNEVSTYMQTIYNEVVLSNRDYFLKKLEIHGNDLSNLKEKLPRIRDYVLENTL